MSHFSLADVSPEHIFTQKCSVVRSIVAKVKAKVKVTSRDYLPLIGWGDSGLRKGDAHRARGEEGGLKHS